MKTVLADRRLRQRRRRRHPGRPQDAARARGPRQHRHHGGDRAEHDRRARRPRAPGATSSAPSCAPSSTTSAPTSSRPACSAAPTSSTRSVAHVERPAAGRRPGRRLQHRSAAADAPTAWQRSATGCCRRPSSSPPTSPRWRPSPASRCDLRRGCRRAARPRPSVGSHHRRSPRRAHPSICLYGDSTVLELHGPRIDTPHTHGTGCTLASALAGYLALGHDVPAAARLGQGPDRARDRCGLPARQGRPGPSGPAGLRRWLAAPARAEQRAHAGPRGTGAGARPGRAGLRGRPRSWPRCPRPGRW